MIYHFPLSIVGYDLCITGDQDEPTIIVIENSSEKSYKLLLSPIAQNQEVWLKQVFSISENPFIDSLHEFIAWANFPVSENQVNWDLAIDIFWKLKTINKGE